MYDTLHHHDHISAGVTVCIYTHTCMHTYNEVQVSGFVLHILSVPSRKPHAELPDDDFMNEISVQHQLLQKDKLCTSRNTQRRDEGER